MTTQAAAQPKARSVRRRLSFLPMLLGIVALGGCGSSSNTTSSASTPTAPASSTPSTPSTTAPAPAPATGGTSASSSLSLAANPSGQLEFTTKALTAKAGKVSIDFTNAASLGHNMTIESASGETVGATPTFQGGSKTLSLNLKPGTYKFFCSVPGHRQAGMEGTLIVK